MHGSGNQQEANEEIALLFPNRSRDALQRIRDSQNEKTMSIVLQSIVFRAPMFMEERRGRLLAERSVRDSYDVLNSD